MPKTPETPDDEIKNEEPGSPEQAPSLEQQLSPEIVEKIMDKVQDINAYGTAFHCLEEDLDLLSIILQDGLIAPTLGLRKRRRDEWLEEKRSGTSYFNIVGRMLKAENLTQFMRLPSPRAFGSTLGLIFDLSHYIEVYPQVRYELEINQEKGRAIHRKYYAVNASIERIADTQNIQNIKHLQDIKVDRSYGFATAGRISPRRFRGLFFRLIKQVGEPGWQHSEYDDDEDKITKHVASLVSVMEDAYKTKPHPNPSRYLLPVYDVFGNLWWPKRMTYEEVKRFVAEREARKQPKNK